jgi:hypothetical protein
MTNEEQKEAGTEPFPSLSFSLFFSHKKNHFINLYVRVRVSAHPMKNFHQSQSMCIRSLSR